jgi:hypothetical protein
VPLDWKSSIIIPLPKKGDLSDCNNWRGTSLPSVPGKVLTTLLLCRIRGAIGKILREEQAGFRAGRACSGQIFTLSQIIENVTARQKPVILNFIDFISSPRWCNDNFTGLQRNGSRVQVWSVAVD